MQGLVMALKRMVMALQNLVMALREAGSPMSLTFQKAKTIVGKTIKKLYNVFSSISCAKKTKRRLLIDSNKRRFIYRKCISFL